MYYPNLCSNIYAHINGFMIFSSIIPLIYLHASRATGCLSNRARSALCHTIRAWSQVKLGVNWWKIQATQAGYCFLQLLGLGLRSASQRIPAPGPGPDWAGSGTRRRRTFQWKCWFSIVFIRAQLRPSVATGSLDFLVFLMLFAAECANVHADSEYYCESPDIWCMLQRMCSRATH